MHKPGTDVVNLTDGGLENSFVRLEPWEETHYAPLKAAADEPTIWQHTLNQGYGSGFDGYWNLLMSGSQSGEIFPFVVRQLSNNEIIGSTSFLSISTPHQRIEIGHTWYVPGVQGGYANPASKRLMLGRAFDWGAKRVELKTDILNVRSQAAMKKMGATMDGVLRSHMVRADGTRRDTVYFSILLEEWEGVRSRLDARLEQFRAQT